MVLYKLYYKLYFESCNHGRRERFMDIAGIYCPNKSCKDYGKKEHGNIVLL